MHPSGKKLNSEKVAVERTGLSPSNLRRRRKLRLPPDFVKLGDRVFYADEALDRFIEENTVRTSEPVRRSA
jgi:hypothetical protein